MTARQELDFRAVDALTGSVAASPVPAMLAAADEISGQAAEIVSLRRDLAAIGVEYDRLKRDRDKLAEVSDGLACAVDRLSDERDEALVRADELWVQVCDQAAELNALRAQLDRARAERDTLVAGLADDELVGVRGLLQERDEERWAACRRLDDELERLGIRKSSASNHTGTGAAGPSEVSGHSPVPPSEGRPTAGGDA